MKLAYRAIGLAVVFGTVCLSGGTGCSGKIKPSPLMSANGLSTKVASSGLPSANTDIAADTTSVSVTMKLNRSALFNQEFIYQADLQYSNLYDKQMDLYTQSSAMGAWPASFRIAGDQLQLVADMKYKYPSDVNHPEQLLSTYQILAQDADTLTVSAADSTIFLAMQLGPAGDNTKNVSVLNHWVRSVDFVPNGNYLLQQTSLQLADATTFEIMESVFPRSALAPGKDFKAFKMSPTSLTGAADDSLPEVTRFRFLAGDAVFTGEDKHAWAEHFDLSPNADGSPATIEWYVTPNIPDQYLRPVQEAVEGWNRYFRSYAGFNRDVLVFKGRLPGGIHLGDPRFNVINWDSRTVAGAAYESQDIDPETGKQSHSIIYMPAAWVTIGTTYWNLGQASDFLNQGTAPAAKARYASHISCSHNLTDAAMTVASGALAPNAVQNFGVEILKQTLFHEVGHALGLAHNFKAYTSWDPTIPGTLFSTSIMAYNDYEIERAAFSAIDSTEGPLLEYDRQALSAIYDQGRDIGRADPVLPTCADAEADNQDGGVDPLCIRYANEWDPTLSVQDAYSLITQSAVPGTADVTLIQALGRVPAIALSDDKVAAIKTRDDLQSAVTALGAQLKGSMTFYVVSGKRSLDYTMRLNVKSLYEFEEGTLPANYDELAMRERIFTGVQESLNLLALPEAVNTAANAAIADGLARLAQTPAMQSMNSSDRDQVTAGFRDGLTKALGSFTRDATAGLPKLRLAVIGALARQDAVPFFVGSLKDAQRDYETAVTGLLADIVSKIDPARLAGERVAAAKALATFKGRQAGDSAIEAIAPGLAAERKSAATNLARETIERIVAALN